MSSVSRLPILAAASAALFLGHAALSGPDVEALGAATSPPTAMPSTPGTVVVGTSTGAPARPDSSDVGRPTAGSTSSPGIPDAFRGLDGLAPEVLELALEAAGRAFEDGLASENLLTVIDYSLPSTERRLWVLDLDAREVLFHELVAHGRNTGGNHAEEFSNVPGSKQSSIGLFRTAETYVGGNGYSLRLDGLEPRFNGLARERLIVMHGAWYVSEELAARQGRIGRSWGCPALREEVAREVIDTIRGGSLVFSYHPDEEWLQTSRFLADEPRST